MHENDKFINELRVTADEIQDVALHACQQDGGNSKRAFVALLWVAARIAVGNGMPCDTFLNGAKLSYEDELENVNKAEGAK